MLVKKSTSRGKTNLKSSAVSSSTLNFKTGRLKMGIHTFKDVFYFSNVDDSLLIVKGDIPKSSKWCKGISTSIATSGHIISQ